MEIQNVTEFLSDHSV